jgi:FAD-dependent monooxygenase
VVYETDSKEPDREIERYTPTTWPGGRPPHVFLDDGETSIFDLLGSDFSLTDFGMDQEMGELFLETARKLGIPMTKIQLPEESHVRKIWERDMGLVRPDGFVCWRLPIEGRLDRDEVRSILEIVSGNH